MDMRLRCGSLASAVHAQRSAQSAHSIVGSSGGRGRSCASCLPSTRLLFHAAGSLCSWSTGGWPTHHIGE